MTPGVFHETITEPQENTMSPALMPAFTASLMGAVEQDDVPVGECRAGRNKEANCTRKSRRMQDMLGMMAGWTA